MHATAMGTTLAQRLGDQMKAGSNADTAKKITEFIRDLEACSQWAKHNCPRTDQRLMLEKLLAACARYARLPLPNPHSTAIEILALATRGVFEIGIRTKYLLLSDENVDAWKAEALRDRIQVYTAILELSHDRTSVSDIRKIESIVDETRRLAEKHDLDTRKRPPSAESVARDVGLETDYTAFFKLYSKIVHPTAWSVNYPSEEIDNLAIRNLLLVNLQLYTCTLAREVAASLGGPPSLIKSEAT